MLYAINNDVMFTAKNKFKKIHLLEIELENKKNNPY